ncbi:putative polyamine oxidase 5 [Heracleum sosnowskyi]|uniref:Polyamine oxidase 5 n=1 Tax=Heracleum sosnowskyi TaxID=360622 RepID=A0AAD8GVN0_9APIA|nr:putative polyamine oxidase 5 [Heracleum sosnowskyi]
MVVKKPRIVIIGAGMAGLTAANKLYTAQKDGEAFELCVFEGGSRIGGRINTSEFGGDRIEMGATWIHGIGNSPVYKIAQEIDALQSEQPWECMDGFLDDPVTIAEGGLEGKNVECQENVAAKAFLDCGSERPSLGCFLRNGLEAYWDSVKNGEEDGGWSRKLLEEAIFAMHENTQRTYTSAGDLMNLDYTAESEYRMFPGEEITIAKGYMSIIESIASVLPDGLIQLGRKVEKIEWQPSSCHGTTRPVKLQFSDGTTFSADHVIVTVSLGVLKARIRDESSLFSPPLPSSKNQAISKLGYGVVNKLFLQVSTTHDEETSELSKFPFLQMAFHQSDSKLKNPEIPWWLRRTAYISPIYKKSSVVLAWLAGKEALALESLDDEEILEKVSTTISSFLSSPTKLCNGNASSLSNYDGEELKYTKVLRTKWGTDPLFMGSYSYVAVGSSGDDIDKLAEPLPENGSSSPPLQILFAGEATHRTRYSTTHGAYLSGLREANRLLKYYNKCISDL